MNYNSSDQNIEFTNPSYVNNAHDTETLQEMVQDRMAKENLVGNNLDPASVKKRNDIKVIQLYYLSWGIVMGEGRVIERREDHVIMNPVNPVC